MSQYPKHYGPRADRKELSRKERRVDDNISPIETTGKVRKKKNTRLWCKGIVDREHITVWEPWLNTISWKRERCITCGKILSIERIK